MGLFGNILEKLGIKKSLGTKVEAPKTTTAAKPQAQIAHRPVAAGKPGQAARPMAPGEKPAMPMVDVVTKLEGLAKANPAKLDWKVSIVDLLKLLDLDSSLDARKELAKELGCPADKIGGDYSQMNMWLHKEVLKKIAENGGNIPASLLD